MIRLTFLVLVLSALALCQNDYVGGPQGRVKRQMMKYATKWTNGQVNYYIEGSLPDPMAKASLIAGMDYISNRTCIKFAESSTAPQRIKVLMSSEAGCASYIGAPGTMNHPTGESLFYYGSCSKMVSIAVHELLHSLGAVHEHLRAERDDFLWVNQSEINRRGLQNALAKNEYFRSLGLVPFEHGSVMGYEVSRYTRFLLDQKDLFGAWNEDYTYTLGNRRITFFDMWKVNDFYQCWCPGTEHCKNGGYSNPKDCTKCVCPMGWFGNECESRQPSTKQLPKATTNWQTATIDFKFQQNAENVRGYHSTYTYIDAPLNKTVEVKVTKMDNFACQPGCNIQGIEIKTVIYKNDNRITSPILCCDDAKKQPLRNKTFTSTQNPTIIDTYTLWFSQPSSVTIQYRHI